MLSLDCHLQLELSHTVSLHLRAERIGSGFQTPAGSEAAAQAVLRALSRIYAICTGSFKSGDNLAWLQDIPDHYEAIAAVANKIDRRLVAGTQLMDSMPHLFSKVLFLSISVYCWPQLGQ